MLQNKLKHLAIIMDGNGRWAKQRKLSRKIGHQEGKKTLKRILKHSYKNGVNIITVFAFSTENWLRPDEEVQHLMNLFLKSLVLEKDYILNNKIGLKTIGNITQLKLKLQQKIQEVSDISNKNPERYLNIAVNYSGRWDLIEAFKKINNLKLKATEQNINKHLSLSEFPDPDLLIRTGNELRISNFLLWQLSYTELFFSKTLWPDMREEELDKILFDFLKRKRKFGSIK